MKKQIVRLFSVLSLCLLFSGCAEKELQDGWYTIEAELTGGTGRVSIDSPTEVVVENGSVTATIVWSSPFYEYMLVDDTRYDPIQNEGNSTFQIPVVLDRDMEVSASTIAMSQPHLIYYTLRFESATLKGVRE